MFDPNDSNRQKWIETKISNLENGLTILDAGAGEMRHKPLCGHLNYVSQDICQYDGVGDGNGLQTGKWVTDGIDIVSDITSIPLKSHSIDVILCSEVLEHVTDPVKVLNEFSRLLKEGGKLIITAPFSSMVHFAPYHFSTGFSRYWYEYHLPQFGLEILELEPNGDWFEYLNQEITRLGPMSKRYNEVTWPMAYLFSLVARFYFRIRIGRNANSSDFGCFGWHCYAQKK